MRIIIPFITQLEKDEEKRWLKSLQEYFSEDNPDATSIAKANYEILPFGELTDLSIDLLNEIKVAIVANPSAEQLNKLPNLQWIQSVWAGVEGLIATLSDSNTKIVKLIDPNLADNMAHSVLAACYSLQQKTEQYRRQQAQQIWLPLEQKKPSETQIGILGLGQLGKHSAEKLRDVGFKVSGWSKSPKELENITTFSGLESLNKFLANIDILVSLLPLTDETRYLLNEQTLSKLPLGAAIINFSRGQILDIHSLINKLNSQTLSHAILDVFEIEPLPTDSSLWKHPQITVLPHISAKTDISSASKIVANNIRTFYEKGIIPKSINLELGY